MGRPVNPPTSYASDITTLRRIAKRVEIDDVRSSHWRRTQLAHLHATISAMTATETQRYIGSKDDR